VSGRRWGRARASVQYSVFSFQSGSRERKIIMFNPKISAADRSANGGALAATLQVATAPARLYSVTLFNTGGAQYIQVFDSAGTPAALAVPKLQIKIQGDDDRSIDFGDGRIFTAGIFIGNSTTSGTYTPGAADCLIDATYRLQ
jgi:hypothetical protein